MIDRATPEMELHERDALKQVAEHENWDFGDYSAEDQFLDVKFGYWIPRLAHYSIVILLSSIVETQLLAYARRVGEREKSPFEPKDLKGSVLERAALYVRKVSGVELTKNERWKVLKDLQDLRDTIVHRAGKPGDDKKDQFAQMGELYPGVSIDENPYTIQTYSALGLTINSCRYFAREVEAFFKDLFNKEGWPVETGLWPNIESGFR
jgi:hypothetical protein